MNGQGAGLWRKELFFFLYPTLAPSATQARLGAVLVYLRDAPIGAERLGLGLECPEWIEVIALSKNVRGMS